MSNTTKTLAQAAQAVLDRWDSPQWKWLKHGPTADLMADLRTALAAAPDAPAPTASAEPVVTPPCQGMNCGCTDGVSHSIECCAEHAAAIAGGTFINGAHPAPAVAQTTPTPTLWRVRPLTGGDWTYYDFQPKYALADSTKEVQAFAEIAVSGATKEGGAA